jgi:hypothetical protein
MKFKATISLILALSMMLTFTAFGTPADGPQGGPGSNESQGATNLGQSGPDNWILGGDNFTAAPNRHGDDVDTTAGRDTGITSTNPGTAGIYVWAKVGETDPAFIYSADIAWGDMKFAFNYNTQWNPVTRVYDVVEAAWAAADVDSINNAITVYNRSNNNITAGFGFALTTVGSSTHFNAAAGGANNVAGNFFATNANAITASERIVDTAMVSSVLTSPITIANADGNANVTTAANAWAWWGNTTQANFPNETVYFAFSGTPDLNTALVNATPEFTNVGTITVTITPAGTDHTDKDHPYPPNFPRPVAP